MGVGILSLEIVLVPLAIAITKEIAEEISEHLEKKKQHKIFKTRMKDEELLKQALEELNCTFRKINSTELIASIKKNESAFLRAEDGCFSFVAAETNNNQEYIRWLESVEETYTHYLQQKVYQTLLERAAERGLILEKEELFEDNSIQITYVLQK